MTKTTRLEIINVMIRHLKDEKAFGVFKKMSDNSSIEKLAKEITDWHISDFMIDKYWSVIKRTYMLRNCSSTIKDNYVFNDETKIYASLSSLKLFDSLYNDDFFSKSKSYILSLIDIELRYLKDCYIGNSDIFSQIDQKITKNLVPIYSKYKGVLGKDVAIASLEKYS